MDLVLASSSPRRRQLMERFGFDFAVAEADIDELERGSPVAVVETNARQKGAKVKEQFPQAIVIGADTIVVLENAILGKPTSDLEAKEMLNFLSGRTHEVITAVSIFGDDQAVVFHETTKVTFRSLTTYEINAYVATGEPFDKAGSYGIQGFGGLFVESINGCYYNVVGLPVPRLVLELRKFGVDLFSILSQGRN